MQAIGVKTTVTINSDPNAGKASSEAAPPPPPPPPQPDAGKPSLIVEEGRGKTVVKIEDAATPGIGTVVAEGSTLQPPLGNTRIHIQEGSQVQQIRDTRTRIQFHEPVGGGTVIGRGVVMHTQTASPDPHGRTRVSIVEPAQRVGASGTTVTQHGGTAPEPQAPQPEPPAAAPSEASPNSPKKPRMRGARGGRRSKKKVAKKKSAKAKAKS